MQFQLIETIKSRVYYIECDLGFDTNPTFYSKISVSVSSLQLHIDEANWRVKSITGTLPFNECIQRELNMPNIRSSGGRQLRLIERVEFGKKTIGSYATFLSYYDKSKKLFCVGDPNSSGSIAMITENAFALISDIGEIEAIWIKPEWSVEGHELGYQDEKKI